jgi:carbon starvation protein
MIEKESDIRPIGYGGMLVEGVVGIVALITASALHPGDYFAINTPPEVFATLHLPLVNLMELQREVGEVVIGRTGGAVSLAVGMAQIFSSLPGMAALMDYWYHFAIMFEAVFILTTIDSGTRIGRFVLQEFGGRVWKPFGRADFLPASLGSTILIVLGWGYFIWVGDVSTVWPMFGVANQLLAVVALAVASTLVINIGRAKYVWVTALPCAFVAVTTLVAGYLNIVDTFWPMAVGPDSSVHIQGYVNSICTVIMMICAVIIVAATLRRSLAVLSGRVPVLDVVEA